MISKIRKFVEAYNNVLFLVLAIILVGLVSFGLGRLSVGTSLSGDLIIDSVPIETKKIISAIQDEPAVVQQGSGEIIGNKNSKIYHRSDCSGAKMMSESNKVFFASIIAAKQAGYRPAGNCPGLE